VPRFSEISDDAEQVHERHARNEKNGKRQHLPNPVAGSGGRKLVPGGLKTCLCYADGDNNGLKTKPENRCPQQQSPSRHFLLQRLEANFPNVA